jgi:chorismate mutase/prephenate dehydrogenase
MIINIAGGNGPMGKTHKPIFEAAGHSVIISGRKTTPNLEIATSVADLTIVTVPLPITAEIIMRVAPLAEAIMDFSGVKIHPVNTMLKYSSEKCEVGGLHPLYGLRSSINGESVVYCPTTRSGKKCAQIISAFEKAGAKIVKMTPEEHDQKMDLVQNQRTIMLRKYITEMEESGYSIQEIYAVAPPPTRILLDLLARQVDEANGSMYEEMIEHNHFTSKKGLDKLMTSIQIREYYGRELEPAQKRAADYTRINKNSGY